MKSSDSLFPDFIGNREALQLLGADIAAGRFPHALLIEGPAGCGKRTLARLLARAAVCESAEGRPCGRCTACRKAADGVHPDITVLSGGTGERSFHIDAIRDLIGSAYVLPNEAACRVLILCDAHNMTPQAQNALLKILEEPPRHLLFMLTCENRAQMLPTIRSRTAVVSLGEVTFEEAAPLLKARLPQVDEHTLRDAFAVSGGIIGRVLSGFENDTLNRVLTLTPQLAAALVAPDEWALMSLTAPLDKNKEAMTGILNALHLVFRDALILHYGGTATLSTAPDAAALLSSRCSGTRLRALLEEIEYLRDALRHNMNNTLLLTQLSARLRRAAVG